MAYVFQQGNVWEEENLTSNVVTNRDYANGVQIEYILTSTWSQYYLIEDALGSVRLVTGSTASSVFSSNYKPYGLNYGQLGSSEFMYTGKQNDPVTGFYFYGARFYYPAISRFISEDTSSGSTSPLSLNRYSYVEDNPVSFNDPTGNMIAYLFGGQAYSLHPTMPTPMPTPQSQPVTLLPASQSNQNNGNSVHEQITSIQQQSNPFLIGMTNTATTSSSGQYYGPPTPTSTTTTTKTTQRTSSNPTPSEAGAIVVTIVFFGVGVGLAIGTPFAIAATGPGGLVVGAGAAGAFYGGAESAFYDYSKGGNATPQGAFDAGMSGIVEFVQGAMELFGL